MSSSTELWRHLPFLFQRSYCKTSSVITRLQQEHSGLTSLRLVGVENTISIHALCEALLSNRTLQQVSLCGSFLPALVLLSSSSSSSAGHGHYNEEKKEEEEEEDDATMLLKAIGSLPHLTHLTLTGSEDAEAFPVMALVRLFQAIHQRQQQQQQEQPQPLLDFACQYADWVATSYQELELLGVALRRCHIRNVHITSLKLTVTSSSSSSSTHNTSTSLLDPIVAALGHCEHVEWSMRHPATSSSSNSNSNSSGGYISSVALESLLTRVPPAIHNGQPPSNMLKSLNLGRRIALTGLEFSTICKSLLQNDCCKLRELQLDHVTDAYDYRPLVDMLQHPRSSLRILDVTFATPWMDVIGAQAITKALCNNRVLWKLCLRGAMIPEHVLPHDQRRRRRQGQSQTPPPRGHYCQQRQSQQYLAFLDLLEHHNTTLEELILVHPEEALFFPAPTPTTITSFFSSHHVTTTTNMDDDHHNDNDHFRKMQFYLHLNRQPVTLTDPACGHHEVVVDCHDSDDDNENDDDDTNMSRCGLRTLVRRQNEAIPQHLMLPCLEAARKVDETLDALHRLESTCWNNIDNDNDDDDDAGDDHDVEEEHETDLYGFVYHSSWRRHPHHPKQQQQSKESNAAGGVAALYYLLRQQPSLILALQHKLEIIEEKKRAKALHGNKNMDYSTAAAASIPLLGGASPQLLLLLDDDIVTLW